MVAYFIRPGDDVDLHVAWITDRSPHGHRQRPGTVPTATARIADRRPPPVHVIIGGCGRVGAQLADQLSREEHDVVIIDADPEAFDRIGSAFNGETLIGNIIDQQTLERAGIVAADVLAAVTNLDNANLMAVQIARELFDVKNTIARLFNPQREDSYRKMGVTYVSGTRLVARAIMKQLDIYTFPPHVGFAEGEIDIVELVVTQKGHGMTVGELQNRGGLRIAAIERDGRTRIPAGKDRLLHDDLLVAAVRGGRPGRKARGLLGTPAATRRV
ncbi:MAG: TrkA family potassium uptake protein [Actinobacteria bacterium]|nr:TrkA family potassium uptake protein [Actinomycetota bacterium]